MAKKKIQDINEEEAAYILTATTFDPAITEDFPTIQLPKVDLVNEKLIKGYKERGWDDNRIAARLMISVDKVKQLK